MEAPRHLVDAVVAWYDWEGVVRRVGEHWQAGADHVCLQVISRNYKRLPRASWSELAQALCEPT
jgi:hypothetical protein